MLKAGGKMADSGSVLFNFRRQGLVFVKANGCSEEQVCAAFFCGPWVPLAAGIQPGSRLAAARGGAGNITSRPPSILWRPLQVIDVAMEAGAEDVQTTEGEDGEFAGFKVCICSAV